MILSQALGICFCNLKLLKSFATFYVWDIEVNSSIAADGPKESNNRNVGCIILKQETFLQDF